MMRRLGERLATDRARCWIVFAAALLSFAYFGQGGGPNQNSRFDLVRAIVDEHTLRIDSYAKNTIDKSERDGHFYCDKAPGLSFAATLPYAALRVVRGGGPLRPAAVRGALWFCTIAVVGAMSAAAAAALFALLRRMRVGATWALASVFAWCFGTNAFAYSTIFVAHQLVASLVIVSFAIVQRADARDAKWIALAGFAGSWAAISEYPAAVLGLMLFAYGALRLGLRAMIPFALAALPPIALLAVYNRACFGAPWSLGYQHLAEREFQSVIDRGFFGIGGPSPRAMAELTFGEFRGLLPLSPFVATAVPGFVLLLRRRELRLEGALCLAASAFLALLNASYQRWDGGSAMGPRYFVPALPFVIVACACAFDHASRLAARAPRLAAGTIASCAIAYSVAVCTMCVAVMPEFPDATLPSPVEGIRPPNPRHPITTLVLPLFFEGHVGEKADFANGGIGFASLVRGHDGDAWNAGEKIGLRGTATLVPLVFLWAIAATALAWGARASSEGERDEA
jgi:hypothetical protein